MSDRAYILGALLAAALPNLIVEAGYIYREREKERRRQRKRWRSLIKRARAGDYP